MLQNLDSIVAQAKKIRSTLNLKLVLLAALGIVLMIVGGMVNTTPKPKIETVGEVTKPVVVRSFESELEARLANLLSQVKGAGSVSVSITIESSGSSEHAKNIVKESKITQEKDTAGGVRTTTETKESEQVLLSKENGVDKPVMVRETKPVIKGVLVVAEGAYDSTVKANLTRAVEAVLGIPVYKITVLPQRK